MKAFLLVIGLITFAVGCFFLSTWVFELLWNYVMPTVFKLPVLSFWHSAAIVLLLGFIGSAVKSSTKS